MIAALLSTVAVAVFGFGHMPPPAVNPAIIDAPCPYYGEFAAGCFYVHGLDGMSPPVIYLNPDTLGYPDDKGPLLHEYGHAFVAFNTDQGERNHWVRVAHWHKWYEEEFADFYAGCALRYNPFDYRMQLADQYSGVKPRRVHRMCSLIGRMADVDADVG